MKIDNQDYSQIIVSSENKGSQLVTVNDKKDVIAIISDDEEIIVKNGYKVQLIPVLENN